MTPDESARERVARELYAQYFDWNSNEKIEREARDAWDGKGCEPVGEKTKEHYRKRADRILDALEGESGRPGLGDALYGMVMANLHGDRARDLIYEEYRILHDTPSEGGGEGDTYQVCAVPYPNPETVGWDAQCCRRKGHDGQHAVSQEGLFWGRDPTDRPEATEEGEGRVRGRWYVEEAMGGAGTILEQGAGAQGSPGHIGTIEFYEDAVKIARWWNGRFRTEDKGFYARRERLAQALYETEGANHLTKPWDTLHGAEKASCRVHAGRLLRRTSTEPEEGEVYVDEPLERAVAIIETGDQRLLAADGSAGGQPPDISLDEWRELYECICEARLRLRNAGGGDE